MQASTSHLWGAGASQSLHVVGTQRWIELSCEECVQPSHSRCRRWAWGGTRQLWTGFSHTRRHLPPTPASTGSLCSTYFGNGGSVVAFRYWDLFKCSEIIPSAESLQRSSGHVAQVVVLSCAFKWPVLWVHTLQRVAAMWISIFSHCNVNCNAIRKCRLLKSQTLEMREVRRL